MMMSYGLKRNTFAVKRSAPLMASSFNFSSGQSLAEQFDQFMRTRASEKTGNINLPKSNFKAMVAGVKDEADLETMKDAYMNYVGHKNLLPQSTIDGLFYKALEVGHPSTMLNFLNHHAELLYHPSPKVTSAYLAHYLEQDFDQLKAFFKATEGRYMLQRPEGLNQSIISKAYEAADSETVIDAYLDVLDYDKELTDDSVFAKVLDSVSFEESIDHVLFGHVKEQMEARKLDSRI